MSKKKTGRASELKGFDAMRERIEAREPRQHASCLILGKYRCIAMACSGNKVFVLECSRDKGITQRDQYLDL